MTLWKLRGSARKLGNNQQFSEQIDPNRLNWKSALINSSRFYNPFRLSVTNIEEQVVGSSLVHDTNCIISMPEFALRLQIQVDDPITAELFRIFDTVHINQYYFCEIGVL